MNPSTEMTGKQPEREIFIIVLVREFAKNEAGYGTPCKFRFGQLSWNLIDILPTVPVLLL
jgi:hypothetical protein